MSLQLHKVKVLSVPRLSGSQSVGKGDFLIPKGKVMPAIRAKFQVVLNKSDAGTATFSAAEKKNLLAHFTLTLKVNGRPIFNQVTFKRLRLLQRIAYGTEVCKFSEATVGLGSTIAASTDTTVQWTSIIPTGRLWQLGHKRRDHFAMGRSQAAMMELTIQSAASQPDLPGTTVTIKDTNVVVTLYAETVSAKHDRIRPIPEYIQRTSSSIEEVFEDGLPIALTEGAAVHASTSLNEVQVSIDGEPIVDGGVDPDDALDALQDEPNFASESDVSDDETLLYMASPVDSLEGMASGRLKFRQPRKDLASMDLHFYYVPVYSRDEIEGLVQLAATRMRAKPLLAVSEYALSSEKHSSRLQPFFGEVLFDQDDAEFSEYPGLIASPGGSKPTVALPKGVAERAKVAAASKDGAAASAVAKTVAYAVPGAVQSGRGLSKGSSSIFAQLKGALGF